MRLPGVRLGEAGGHECALVRERDHLLPGRRHLPDADGDGVGDFRGLIRRLTYRRLAELLLLNPIHPSPTADGYDVTDFYNVHPKLGTLGDFAELLQAANSRGIRVMIDLVVNHFSDEHPWFVSACSSPDLAVPRLVRLVQDRTSRPQAGHGVPRRAGGDLDLRRDRRRLVLPSVLQLPARPERHQPAGPCEIKRICRSGSSSG